MERSVWWKLERMQEAATFFISIAFWEWFLIDKHIVSMSEAFKYLLQNNELY